MLWCALGLIENYASRTLAYHHLYNHIVTYVFVPFEGTVVLWALSLWQVRPTARLTLRLLIPPFLIAWILLTLLVEDVNTFSSVAEPVYSILTLGAAVYTLLTLGHQESESLLRQGWFWICVGMILEFGTIAILTPLGKQFVASNPQLVIRAYTFAALFHIFALSIIAYGFLWPQTALPGRSS